MRTFISGSGADVTASVREYLGDPANRQLLFADLYVINTAPCYASQYLGQQFLRTDYPSPLYWGYRGTFVPCVIERTEVESKIGLDAQTVDVTWTAQSLQSGNWQDDTLDLSLTVLQGFRYGIFDNATVEVWRVLMPTPGTIVGSPAAPAVLGDCNTFGAYLLFSGRIGNIEPDRLKVKFTVNSRLELINVQLPPNLIEPTNILAQYSVGTLPPNGPTSFSVVSGSTQNKVYADGSHSGYTPQAGTYNMGYLVFTSGKLAGHYAKIYSQDIESSHHAFYLEDPLPFAPSVSDTLGAYVYVPPDQANAVATSKPYQGFPYVPTPINSAIGII